MSNQLYGSISCHITPLVINSFGVDTHTHTNTHTHTHSTHTRTHTDDLHKINFKKLGTPKSGMAKKNKSAIEMTVINIIRSEFGKILTKLLLSS